MALDGELPQFQHGQRTLSARAMQTQSDVVASLRRFTLSGDLNVDGSGVTAVRGPKPPLLRTATPTVNRRAVIEDLGEASGGKVTTFQGRFVDSANTPVGEPDEQITLYAWLFPADADVQAALPLLLPSQAPIVPVSAYAIQVGSGDTATIEQHWYIDFALIGVCTSAGIIGEVPDTGDGVPPVIASDPIPPLPPADPVGIGQ